MKQYTIPWTTGTGNILVNDLENNTVKISSDSLHETSRSQILTFKTTDNSITKTLSVTQDPATNLKQLTDSEDKILQDSQNKILVVTI